MKYSRSDMFVTGLLRPPLLEFILLSLFFCLYLFFRQPKRLWAVTMLCFGVLAALYPLIFTPLMALWSGHSMEALLAFTPGFSPVTAVLVVLAGFLNITASGLVLWPKSYWNALPKGKISAAVPTILTAIASVLILVALLLPPTVLTWTITYGSSQEQVVQGVDIQFLWLLYIVPLLLCLYVFFKKPGRVWATCVLFSGLMVALSPWFICLLLLWGSRSHSSTYLVDIIMSPADFIFMVSGILNVSAACFVFRSEYCLGEKNE